MGRRAQLGRRRRGGAVVAVVVVLPVAVLAWRYPSRLSRLLERLSLSPSALPGIAVALALVFFGARAGGVVYQSLGLLLFAYILRFMPYALASTRASLDAVSPRLEEAARSLGRRPLGATRSVVLPLARPGLLAGAALVFLSTIKELPVTLLLRRSASTRSRPRSGRGPRSAPTRRSALGAPARRHRSPLRLPALLAQCVGAWFSGLGFFGMAQPHGHSVDEYLETIYFLAFPIGEYRPSTGSTAIAARVAEMLGVSRASAGEMLKRLEAEGLVERGEQKEAILTPTGTERANRVVRKHRIIERFLTDFMGYTAAESHVHADELGDTFTDEMIERINERLGRPDRCPHGWPVEPDVEQAENAELVSLGDLGAGRKPRSSASRSTTATSCTGSTTRGSCPGRRSRCGRPNPPPASSPWRSTAPSGPSARRPPTASTSAPRNPAISALTELFKARERMFQGGPATMETSGFSGRIAPRPSQAAGKSGPALAARRTSFPSS